MSTEAKDGAVTIPGWQVKVFAALLVSAIAAGAGNYLSFRDWRVKTDVTLENIQKATSLPRSEYEIERRYLAAEPEQMRARLTILERRGNACGTFGCCRWWLSRLRVTSFATACIGCVTRKLSSRSRFTAGPMSPSGARRTPRASSRFGSTGLGLRSQFT